MLNWAADAGHPGADYPPPGLSKISRADVAAFMIRTLTESSYLRQSPAICW